MLSFRLLLPKQFLKKNFTSAANSVQEKYLEEQCIHVDKNDQPICSVSKEDCHKASVLHRAFSVFIFDTQKRLLLQKRAKEKITFPGVWSNTCCSHPLYNQAEMDENQAMGVKRAAARKLENELGISNIPLDKFHMVGRFTYDFMSDKVWREHEIDYALVVPNFEGQFTANSEEISETRFVDQKALEKMMLNPDYKFSPWFHNFYKLKWVQLWWDNLEQLNQVKDLDNIHQID